MRVAHVSVYQDPAGRPPAALLEAWPTLGDVAAAVAATGIETAVYQAARADATLERDGVRFTFVGERMPGPFARHRPWAQSPPRRLLVRLAAWKPDIVHLHGLAFARAIRFLRHALPDARVLVQDHADRPPPAWRARLHRRAFTGIDAVAFTAREQAQPFLTSGVLPAGVPIIEVAESSSRFMPGDRAHAQRETGVSGCPAFLWLGHLNANKDPLTILDAFARAVPQMEDPHLWMAFGSTSLLRAVERRIADPVLRPRVHLLGRQPHARVELLLRASDFLLQGSHAEATGYAVLEALACGTTPIVTDIPSFRFLTGNGRHGALCPPGDADAFARAILEWAAKDTATLRRNARDWFDRELSFDALGRRLAGIYHELVRS